MSPNKKWRKNNPLKVAAHTIINNAVRYGKLKKQPCEDCGEEKAHAHHDDYLKPLDVRWLCSKCHRRFHSLEKGLTVGGKVTKSDSPLWADNKQYMPSPKRDALLGQAKELRCQGMSYREIGESIGTSASQVYKWINPKQYK